MKNPFRGQDHPSLPGPYGEAPATDELRPTPATLSLVRGQVRALLDSSAAFQRLPSAERRRIAHDLVKVAAYNAALVHDQWLQAEKLGQTPVLRRETVLEPLARAAAGGLKPFARPQGDGEEEPPPPAAEEFRPRAAGEVARITEQTLKAIAFPTFVADLIQGTFQAMVDASIQQMEAYSELLANVAKTVDQFMADNITDNQARDHAVGLFPRHLRLDTAGGRPRVRVRAEAGDLEPPDFRGALGLDEDVYLEDETVENVLVPAARRKLAEHRHQVLSTMVMMGMQRIVVTGGRIHAKMGFRVDTSDVGAASRGTGYAARHDAEASYGKGLVGRLTGFSATTRSTVAYVSSTKKDSSDEINVETDLTGEVELRFKSDYMPLQRFADSEAITLIRAHTPNPDANSPIAAAGEEAGRR